jgi:hypothetical protein
MPKAVIKRNPEQGGPWKKNKCITIDIADPFYSVCS